VPVELQTAKKIIELLHEETNSTVQHTFTNSQCANTSLFRVLYTVILKNAMNIWNIVNYAGRKHIKQPVVQQQHPIPMFVNRFMLPNIHHEDSEASQSPGMVGKRNICVT